MSHILIIYTTLCNCHSRQDTVCNGRENQEHEASLSHFIHSVEADREKEIGQAIHLQGYPCDILPPTSLYHLKLKVLNLLKHHP